MTTAGRPTWNPAVGSERGQYKLHVPTMQHSSKDLPAHTFLKTRQPGQNTTEDLKKRDLKAELLEREERNADANRRPEEKKLITHQQQQQQQHHHHHEQQRFANPDDDEEPSVVPQKAPSGIIGADAGGVAVLDPDDEASASGDDANDSEDETAELMRELARIKKEREAEQAKLEEEKLRAEAASNANSVLRSNPLVNAAGTAPTIGDDATVKRKWYDETIFKNQAKEDTQTKKAAKRFINDTIRSDFHRNFLDKYIK